MQVVKVTKLRCASICTWHQLMHGAYLWDPIGQTSTNSFKGTFDGCGYKITNMKVDVSTNSGSLCAGLFGLVEAGVEGKGIVKNIIVSGEVKSTGVGNSYTGGIVGQSMGGGREKQQFCGRCNC